MRSPALPALAALIGLSFASSCGDGRQDTLPVGGDSSEDTATEEDTGGGATDCPPPPEPDLSGCSVAMKDNADPERDEPDWSWEWFDASGDLIGSRSVDGDEPEERTLECAFTYGAPGQLQTEQCWGMATYTYTWTWEDGVAVSKVYDKDSDGAADRTWLWTHDADGHVLSESWDTDLDGQHDDGGIAYTWAEGQLATETWDYHGDGGTDLVISYAYDEQGHEIEVLTDQGGDGSIDERITRAFDSGGNPLWEEIDEGDDNVRDRTTTWSYNDACLNNRTEVAEPGSPEIISLQAYEEDGFLYRRNFFYDDEEGWDAQQRWTRTCPADEDPPEAPSGD